MSGVSAIKPSISGGSWRIVVGDVWFLEGSMMSVLECLRRISLSILFLTIYLIDHIFDYQLHKSTTLLSPDVDSIQEQNRKTNNE